MKSGAILAVLALVLFADQNYISPVQAQSRCPNGVRTRNEIRTLSSSEVQAYINAVRQLQRGHSPTRYDKFVLTHYRARNIAHGFAPFFAWHRQFILTFEQALQAIDPSITLPYWDWSYDSQAPETAIVWSPDYFGGNGQGENGCVQDGPFADWQPYYSDPSCLIREFSLDPSQNAFYSPEVLQQVIQSATSYDDLRNQIESVPHANVHNGVGGIMTSMFSPSDPIFFLHHGKIDQIWAQWQIAHPDLANTYNGPNSDGSSARPSDVLTPWNIRVRDVFDTSALCYTYNDLSIGDNSASQALPVRLEDVGPSAGRGRGSGRGRTRTRHRRSYAITKPAADTPAPSAPADTPAEAPSAPADTPAEAPSAPADTSAEAPSENAADTSRQPTDESQPDVAPQKIVPRKGSQVQTSTPEHPYIITGIRLPAPIPDWWVKANNFDVAKVRDYEAKYKTNVYDKLNAIEGYVSPCALSNRGDQLEKLVSKGNLDFAIKSGGKVIPLDKSHIEKDNAKDSVLDLQRQAADVLEKGPDSSTVHSQLVDTIGSSKSAGVSDNSAVNSEAAAKTNWIQQWRSNDTVCSVSAGGGNDNSS